MEQLNLRYFERKNIFFLCYFCPPLLLVLWGKSPGSFSLTLSLSLFNTHIHTHTYTILSLSLIEKYLWFQNVISGLTGGTLIGKFGRKFSMFIVTFFLTLGYLLLSVAFNRWMLFFGRLIIGYGTGLTTIAVPNYVSEVATPNVRGLLGSFFQVYNNLMWF